MKIVLELKEPLTEQEIQRLPILIRDAFGEFQTHRNVRQRDAIDDWHRARSYVLDRYKGLPMSANWIADKTQQVVERCRQAAKLHDAEVSVEP